ncbi:MAG: hypothetical protein ACRDMY_15190 [Gaiellaceae bacterium]
MPIRRGSENSETPAATSSRRHVEEAGAEGGAAWGTVGLSVVANLAVRECAADEHDTVGAAEVAAFEREPFLRARAGARGEQRDRAPGAELDGERFQLRPRVERADLGALRERVRDVPCRVVVEDLPADAGVQHLP